MGEVNYQPSPMFMGLPITPRFAEALGMAQEGVTNRIATPEREEAAPDPQNPLLEEIVK